MSKPYFKSKDNAIEVIRRCLDSIRYINRQKYPFDNITEPHVVHEIGRSLLQHVYTICEALLYCVCCERLEGRDERTPDEWPKVNELKKFCERGDYGYLDCPPMMYEAADKMAKAKKRSDKKLELTPDEIAKVFSEAVILLEWLRQAAGRSIDSDCIEEIRGLIAFIHCWNEQYERKRERNTDCNQWSFRYHDIDAANMTEEEEDEYYKPRKSNKRESMAPLFIYLILQRFSKSNRAHVSDIREILEKEYEISLSRGAVERTLNTMVDGADVNVWSGLKRGSGYWYSERDENDSEEPEETE